MGVTQANDLENCLAIVRSYMDSPSGLGVEFLSWVKDGFIWTFPEEEVDSTLEFDNDSWFGAFWMSMSILSLFDRFKPFSISSTLFAYKSLIHQ